MFKQTALALLALMAVALQPGRAFAQAELAYTLADLNLRLGPGTEYPVIAILPAGAPVEVNGCLQGYAWCDVTYPYEDLRGWVYGPYLGYAGPRYVSMPIPEVAVLLSIPIVVRHIYERPRHWHWHHPVRLPPPRWDKRPHWWHRDRPWPPPWVHARKPAKPPVQWSRGDRPRPPGATRPADPKPLPEWVKRHRPGRTVVGPRTDRAKPRQWDRAKPQQWNGREATSKPQWIRRGGPAPRLGSPTKARPPKLVRPHRTVEPQRLRSPRTGSGQAVQWRQRKEARGASRSPQPRGGAPRSGCVPFGNACR